ncbi:MAG: hypothetical protein R3F62_00385 [Planctomycetota bacterium]
MFEDFPANQAAQVAQRTTDAASNMLREDLLGARGTVEFAALQAFRAVGQDGAETLRAAAVAELLAWALA